MRGSFCSLARAVYIRKARRYDNFVVSRDPL